MPQVAAFYDINQASKPRENGVHHNNSECQMGRNIPQADRRTGTGTYRLCADCQKLNDRGR